jgi:hypothetical protein
MEGRDALGAVLLPDIARCIAATTHLLLILFDRRKIQVDRIHIRISNSNAKKTAVMTAAAEKTSGERNDDHTTSPAGNSGRWRSACQYRHRISKIRRSRNIES